jgi:hypothetical protein
MCFKTFGSPPHEGARNSLNRAIALEVEITESASDEESMWGILFRALHHPKRFSNAPKVQREFPGLEVRARLARELSQGDPRARNRWESSVPDHEL